MERLDLDRIHTIAVSRRTLLRGTLAAALALETSFILGVLQGNPKPAESKATPSPTFAAETNSPTLGVPAFEDEEANQIAKQIGITPDSFFLPSNELLDKLSAFLEDTLYPIYPLSVLERRNLIYELAKQFSVKPNIIATIMTIESAGLKDEPSPAGAQGLFQVMPFHFEKQDEETMRDPLINGRAGMNYFVKTCLPVARKYFPPGYNQNHVGIFARALMVYNGGPDAGRLNIDDLPDETKIYKDHFLRFAITAELAHGLRKKQNGDLDIVKKLSSVEMDARAFALAQFVQRKGGRYSYGEYQTALRELSHPTPGVDEKTKKFTEQGEGFFRDYQAYKDNPGYEVKISPGLRIWLSMGGIKLFLKDPRNTDLKEWDKVQSR